MVIDSFWFEPGSESTADQEAAERTLQFHVSSIFETIFLFNFWVLEGAWLHNISGHHRIVQITNSIK